jgi:hypothetical protein
MVRAYLASDGGPPEEVVLFEVLGHAIEALNGLKD